MRHPQFSAFSLRLPALPRDPALGVVVVCGGCNSPASRVPVRQDARKASQVAINFLGFHRYLAIRDRLRGGNMKHSLTVIRFPNVVFGMLLVTGFVAQAVRVVAA